MRKALSVVLAAGLLLFLAGPAIEASHRNWGGGVSVGQGGYWQAGLYWHQGRSFQPGLWVGGEWWGHAPAQNWNQKIWVLGHDGQWRNNQYHWQNNDYQPPLYVGNSYYDQPPGGWSGGTGSCGVALPSWNQPQPVCWQECWQEPVYRWVWVTRYDHRGRPYQRQEQRLIGYQTRCQTRCNSQR